MPDDRVLEIEKRIDRDVVGSMELSVHNPALAFAPKSMGEVTEFAKLMAVAGVCIRPQFRGNPGACLAITIQAMKWGADPFAVANKAFVVNDQISYESQLIHAIVNSSSVLARRLRPTFEGEGQTRKCRIVGFVKGEDEAFEYESPMFKDIPVKNSPLWKSDPDQQLFYYATRAWARRHVPEILLGIYAPEEFAGETIDLTPEPEPRREDFMREATREDTRLIEFDVVADAGGEVVSFATAERACEAVIQLFKDAGRGGAAALEAAWENNEPLFAQLGDAGENDAIADLSNIYESLRDHCMREMRAEAAAAAPRGAEADTNSPAGAHLRKEGTLSGDPPAGDTVYQDAALFPGDLPAGERLVPRHPPTAETIGPGSGHTQEETSDDAGSVGDGSRKIAMVAPAGQPNYRAWAGGLLLPKIRQQRSTVDLSWLLADNAEELDNARRAMLTADRKQLDEAIAAQWKVIEQLDQGR